MMYKARIAYRDYKIADAYDKKRFHSIKGKVTDYLEKSAIEKALNGIPIPAASRILDLPCGTGRISALLAKKGHMIIGGDISPAMIDNANKNMQTLGFRGETEFRVIDAENIDFSNNYFDIVLSLRFFGHTPPDVRMKVLHEFKRVGKKYFIVAYYIKNSLQEILRRKDRLAREVPWYPVSFKDIKREMNQVGIKTIKIIPVLRYVSETVVVLGEAYQ